MTDQELLDYFDSREERHIKPNQHMTREAWLDARFALLTLLWRCTDAELADTAWRWLARKKGE
jgi:hypothetical protein